MAAAGAGAGVELDRYGDPVSEEANALIPTIPKGYYRKIVYTRPREIVFKVYKKSKLGEEAIPRYEICTVHIDLQTDKLLGRIEVVNELNAPRLHVARVEPMAGLMIDGRYKFSAKDGFIQGRFFINRDLPGA